MQPTKRKNNTDFDVCKKQRTVSCPQFLTLPTDVAGLILEFLFRSRLDKETYCNFRLVSRNFRDITNTPRYFPHLRGLLESSHVSDPAELRKLNDIHSSSESARKTTLYFLKRFAPYLKEIDLLNATSDCFLDRPFRNQLLLIKEKIVGLSCLSMGNLISPILKEIGAFQNLKKIKFNIPRNEVAFKSIVDCMGNLPNLEKIHLYMIFLFHNARPLFDLPTWKFLQVENITIQRSDLNQDHPIGWLEGRIYSGPTTQYERPCGEGYFFSSSGEVIKNYGA